MPEAFKNLFNTQLVEHLAGQLKRVFPAFDAAEFVNAVLAELESLELKQRSELICQQLSIYLPKDFIHSSEILHAVLGECIDADTPGAHVPALNAQQGVNGWAIMPLADYVALHGMQHFELSMALLKEMTKRSSSEFAIRPFLEQKMEQTMQVMHLWVLDADEHVRRLASEGARPRLPWGMQLKQFVQDPRPLFPLLEKLKDDPSEYVRRSVANNLNDISKDHPELVAKLAHDWLVEASDERKKLVQHACRSLIKRGHPDTLMALGYGEAELSECSLVLSSSQLIYGDSIYLSARICSVAPAPQSLMVDYIVHHQKANGSTTAKVFKWRSAVLHSGTPLTLSKKHTIKPITTRVYYPGLHKVQLQVNGHVMAQAEFELLMPNKN